MRDTFSHTLYQVATQDPSVAIVVADISPAASMAPYRADFPDRFVNVGVSEQSMISLCAGMAMRGCNPFAYTIAPFTIYRPFEHIRVELCYQNLPVTLVGVGAGTVYSQLGGTHNAIEDVSVMSALPNMTVVAPCDPRELSSAVWACAANKGPVYLRVGKSGESDLTEAAPEPFQFGKIRCIQQGEGACVLGYGPILSLGISATKRLAEETGRNPAVYSAHTLKPLDRSGIARILSEFEAVVVLEEHVPHGGLGMQVQQIAWENRSSCQISHVCLKDEFVHNYGTHEQLLEAHGISVETVLRKLKG